MGASVLVWAEQWLGHSIQFLRFVPDLARLGARGVLQLPAALVRLAGSLGGAPEILAEGAALPAHALHCPLLSLPGKQGLTRIADLTADMPYLAVDSRLDEKWRNLLPDASRPRIGLMWRGSARGSSDPGRALGLERLVRLFELPYDYVCVGKEVSDEERRFLTRFPNVALFCERLDDMADTAALLARMDVVLSVDTPVAHLASAPGLPVWVLLSYAADWRWGVDGIHTPCYPRSTRLFHQRIRGDWSCVLNNVEAELASVFPGRSNPVKIS